MPARTRRIALLAVLCAGVAGCGGGQDEARRPNTIAPAPRAASADATPAAAVQPRLTAAQLAGQHVIFPFSGTAPPAALVARIRRGEAAGVILFARNVASVGQVRALTRRLQRIARPPGLRAPLLVMVDQEGGPVKRLPGAPQRSPRELAAAGSAALARVQGRATAATLRGAGVNVDLAPVLDVARPGGAIDREGRGLGATAPAVARVGVAFAQGLQRGGVLATAKHFPGFGAATSNTDLAQTVIGLPAATLRRVDEAPFADASAHGIALVMVASARYPAFSRRPAVLARAVVGGELRARVRFRGVTISDDLQAPALAPYGGASGAAVRAARAGVDLLLFGQSYAGAADAARALADALRRGGLDRERAEASLQRVLAVRGTLR